MNTELIPLSLILLLVIVTAIIERKKYSMIKLLVDQLQSDKAQLVSALTDAEENLKYMEKRYWIIYGENEDRLLDLNYYKNRCKLFKHRVRYDNFIIDELTKRWTRAAHHIEQLVHSIKEPEVNKMSLGKLLATYHHESQLVESHLVDRFNSVKIKDTSATYTSGINYLHLNYDVFGFPAMANFSRTGNEGYMMVITYRGVIVYSDKTPDKSYFVQVCENAMLEFITKFDLKFGRK